MNRKTRILGLDPGSHVTGWGVIDCEDGEMRFVDCGAIRSGKRTDAIAARLATTASGLRELIRKHRPDSFAIEKAFYGKSIESAFRLGEARGAALLCAAEAKLSIAEYPPAVVKKSIVGFGQADKSQVSAMVQNILRLKTPPEPIDAADALAIALCHAYRSLSPTQGLAFESGGE